MVLQPSNYQFNCASDVNGLFLIFFMMVKRKIRETLNKGEILEALEKFETEAYEPDEDDQSSVAEDESDLDSDKEVGYGVN